MSNSEQLFYRQTEDAETLEFRKKLYDLSDDEIFNVLIQLQQERNTEFALECHDEMSRRNKRREIEQDDLI